MDEKMQFTGLTKEEVQYRVERGYFNKPVKSLTNSYKKIFRENICTLFNFINVIIALLVAYTGSYKNLLFLGIIFSNIVIGIFQEIRAKKSIDKLSIINQSKPEVIRDGKKVKVRQDEIVKDDIMIINRGDLLCVDGIVLHTNGIEVDESQLTGESDAVGKFVDSEVMSGSSVVSGSAYIKVTNIGSDSFASKIAMEAKKSKDIDSEIIKTMKKIIKILTFAVIPIGIILFLTKIYYGISLNQSLLGTSAALIGMIPEGLILLTSVALAVSVVKLSAKGVQVKTMGSIENLARVDMLCLDKTGTITDGSIKLVEIIEYNGVKKEDLLEDVSSFVKYIDDYNATTIALRDGLPDAKSLLDVKKITPFSSARKWSGISFKERGSYVLGAYEYVMKELSKDILDLIDIRLNKGERVLIFCHSEDTLVDEFLPDNLKLLGIVVMEDNIRKEAPDSLNYFKMQGVDIRVISGDNAKSVSQIAMRAGVDGADKFIDMSSLDEKDNFVEVAKSNKVFGRVTPYQKRELIKSFKKLGYVVGMTGDGVNDILALKEADCSIAMAEGSDAAKGVSDFVLLKSNFESLIGIVMEGRRVINNVQEVASQYLMKTVYSTILAVLFIFIHSAYPFHPIQLMPINALGVGIPSFFLALRPNYSKIGNGFFLNILKPAFTSGCTVVIYVLYIMIIGNIFGYDFGEKSTLSVILTGAVCFISLYYVSRPINRLITGMLSLLVFVFVIGVVFFGNLFSLVNILNVKLLIVLIPLLITVHPVYRAIKIFVNLFHRGYKFFKKKLKSKNKGKKV